MEVMTPPYLPVLQRNPDGDSWTGISRVRVPDVMAKHCHAQL